MKNDQGPYGDGTYCSQRHCGLGCTRAQYDNVQDAAAALARRLGPGWSPVLWENLGWHYKVVSASGHLTVSVYERVGRRAVYRATFSEAEDVPTQWWSKSCSTPEAAVADMQARVTKHLEEMMRWVAATAEDLRIAKQGKPKALAAAPRRLRAARKQLA